jgi:ribosomal protein L11 methyltransferase
MDWLELAVAADEEAVDAVAEVLRAHGHGVAIDEPFVQPRIDEAPQPDPSRRPIVKTYIPDDEKAPGIQQEVEHALWHLGQLRAVEPLGILRIAEEDWANSWKPFFPVLHLGRRTVIVPAWRRHHRQEGEIIVRLDPGLAFGTGMHPTTRLCLQGVEEMCRQGDRVLDVGTGSGILSIAAARLGAARVVGVDTDPIAARAARANVRLNHVSRTVRIFEGSLPDGLPTGRAAQIRGDRGPFNLILANVTARVNAALAPAMAPLLAPGGHLVASGILADTADMVSEAFAAVGLRTERVEPDGDWVAITASPTL